LHNQYPNTHLILIGPKHVPRDAVSTECYEAMSRDPTIHVTGDVKDPLHYYALGHIVVHPSFREGFPNAILEGAALCMPAITTNAIGCIDAVVDNETGLIVDVNNVQALFEAMKKLLLDSELRKRMGFAARERALRDFDPGFIAGQVFRFITEKNYV
jgi:glycosyltransferase involved in cell wall biosynthesis